MYLLGCCVWRPAERRAVSQQLDEVRVFHRRGGYPGVADISILGMVKLVHDAVAETFGGNSTPVLIPFAYIGES